MAIALSDAVQFLHITSSPPLGGQKRQEIISYFTFSSKALSVLHLVGPHVYFVVPINKLLDRFGKATALTFRDAVISWRFKVTASAQGPSRARGQISHHYSARLSWGSLYSFWYRTLFLSLKSIFISILLMLWVSSEKREAGSFIGSLK